MLKKDFEVDDPFVLVGQGFASPEGCDSQAEMARCFIEEYAMLGFSEDFVLRMFQNSRYQGPHSVLTSKGEDFVRGLITEVYGCETAREGAHG